MSSDAEAALAQRVLAWVEEVEPATASSLIKDIEDGEYAWMLSCALSGPGKTRGVPLALRNDIRRLYTGRNDFEAVGVLNALDLAVVAESR